MKTIYKYPITPDSKAMKLPKGAEILTVQMQHGAPMMWALVDKNIEEEARHFEIYGTGHDIYYDMGVERKYIGTFQVEGGMLVFHLFERIN